MNNQDKLLSAAMATFFIIVSCNQTVTNERPSTGESGTVQITESPQIVDNPVGLIVDNIVDKRVGNIVDNLPIIDPTFDATLFNCGFVAVGTDTLIHEYQCWQVNPDTCFEDMECWDCESMGNKVCSRQYMLHKYFGNCNAEGICDGYEWEIDLQVRAEVEGE